MSTDLTTNEGAWSAAAGWGDTDRMNELEAFMWRSERHPRFSSTICALMILDTVPDWDRFYAAHDWACDLVARTRQRVLEPALGIGAPAWVPDEHFTLSYHLRRVHLPPPGGMRELLSVASSIAMQPFDRARPLWEGVLVEGLDGGKAAYVLKLHHSLTDGLGGIQLMSLVQSRTRRHTPDKPRRTAPLQARHHDPLRLSAAEIAADLKVVPAAVARVAATGLSALRRPGLAASETVRYAASLRRVLSPPPAAPSPLLRRRTGRAWQFGALEGDLAELKAAARKGRGSVNDAYIAALLGGLRRYHEHHGVQLDELPIAMPISLRKADDPMGGNKFAGALLAAPIGIADPAERISDVRGTVLATRTEPALDTFSLIAPVANRLPSGIGAFVARLGAAADLSASNVPGIPYPVYMAGALVERNFPFGPLPGVAVMAAMVSHAGTCCIGINSDAAAITDHDVFMTCLREGLDEVLELAR